LGNTVLASAVEGVLTSEELSAIEPKRERYSCVLTWRFRTTGSVFCAAVLRLAAPASRVN